MEKDDEDEAACIFIELLTSCNKRQMSSDMVKLSNTRLETVAKASNRRKDNLDIHSIGGKVAHRACLLEYTSSDHIIRHLKRKNIGKQQEACSN